MLYFPHLDLQSLRLPSFLVLPSFFLPAALHVSCLKMVPWPRILLACLISFYPHAILVCYPLNCCAVDFSRYPQCDGVLCRDLAWKNMVLFSRSSPASRLTLQCSVRDIIPSSSCILPCGLSRVLATSWLTLGNCLNRPCTSGAHSTSVCLSTLVA